GCKIYSINKNIKYADKVFWNEGPETFINLVANAELVLTNSFHAVAFSLIFGKNFYVFNRNVNINTRMRDLLSVLDLKDLIITNSSQVEMIRTVDYKIINEILDKLKDRSKSFLKNALNYN